MKSSYDQFFAEKKRNLKNKQVLRSGLTKQPVKRKRSFPLGAFILLTLSVGIFGVTVFYPDEFDQIFQKIEVHFMTMATAADEKPMEKSAADAAIKAASSTESALSKLQAEERDKGSGKAEDTSYLSKLNERKKELDLREKELNELEEELHRQRDEVEVRIKKLEEIRGQIASVLKQKVEVDQTKVDKLVEFYSNMKPKQAADILATINEDLAVEILGKMKKKNAAEIMDLLTPSKAQIISEKFAGYKRR